MTERYDSSRLESANMESWLTNKLSNGAAPVVVTYRKYEPKGVEVASDAEATDNDTPRKSIREKLRTIGRRLEVIQRFRTMLQKSEERMFSLSNVLVFPIQNVHVSLQAAFGHRIEVRARAEHALSSEQLFPPMRRNI